MVKTTQSKKYDFLFLIIPIAALANLYIRWYIRGLDFITPDSKSYFRTAEEFPTVSDSLFPVFYPINLKILNVFDDYYMTYKIVSVISVIFCFAFVKIYDFYWKEIWTMLSFYHFFALFPYAWSEVIMIPLLLIYVFVNFKFLYGNLKNNTFITANAIVLLIMMMTKYSSVFLLIGAFAFTIILWFYSKHKAKIYFVSLLFSSIAFSFYILVNKYLTGEFMGSRPLPDFGGTFNIRMSVSNILFTLNPIVLKGRMNNIFGFVFGWGELYFISGVFLITWIFIICKAIKKNYKRKLIILFCVISALLFVALTLYSYLTTRIDVLSVRLLLPYYLLIFMAVIFSVEQYKKKDFLLMIIAVASIIINIYSAFVCPF